MTTIEKTNMAVERLLEGAVLVPADPEAIAARDFRFRPRANKSLDWRAESKLDRDDLSENGLVQESIYETHPRPTLCYG